VVTLSLSGSGASHTHQVTRRARLRACRWLLLLMLSLSPLTCGAQAYAAPAIVSPADGTVLPGGDIELVWENDGTEVLQWWVYAGRSVGGLGLANEGPLPVATDRFTLDAVPADGRTLHARLWWRTAADGWQSTDHEWAVAGETTPPGVVSPAAQATLEGDEQRFTWQANDRSDVQTWWVQIGSAQGGNDVADSGALEATTRSFDATGLPADGRTVHLRLWYRAPGGSWQFEDTRYTAATLTGTVLLSTAADTELQAGDPLNWSVEGRAPAEFWLYLGSAQGGRDLVDSGSLPGSQRDYAMPANLPSDGRTLHARLWFRFAGGAWQSIDRTFVAVGEPLEPAFTSPAANQRLRGVQTLEWETAAVERWWLYVGSSAGKADLHDSGALDAGTTSARITGIPTDGKRVHARLWYRASGSGWQFIDRDWRARVSPSWFGEYELAFADEFDGDALDPQKWNTGLLWGPYLPINNEEQLYVDTLGMHQDVEHSPFDVSNGTLKITATPVTDELQPPERPAEDDSVWGQYGEYRHNGPNDDGPGYQEEDVNYLSGIITSYDSFKFARGYVEARAKLPAGQGLWPAFWTLNAHYIEQSPEIDVMEFLGQFTDRVYHTYHYFEPQNNWRKISTPSFETRGDSWTTDFHTYGMEWSPKAIVWYVDGVETRRVTDADYLISRQAMYLLANLAVGGNWPGAPDASTAFPATYEIDYIRAYRRKDPEPVDLDNFQLVFEDEFDGNALDPDKWNTEFLWGPYLRINEERQYYVDTLNSDAGKSYSPFEFEDGIMSIVARPNAQSGDAAPPPEAPLPDDPIWTENPGWARPHSETNPYEYVQPDYTSGLITSRDSFMFAYGYAEARMQLPEGDGLWPAFWLLNSYYIAQQPEIDIMEARGSRPFEVSHSYHRNNDRGVQSSDSSESRSATGAPTFTEAFHTYGVRWSPTKITWYIDGEPVYSIADGTVGYQLMYVLANLAVGGNYPYQPVDDDALPARLQIDYIRVYQERELN